MINILSNGGVALSAEALAAVLHQIIVKIWIWEIPIQDNEASLVLFCTVTLALAMVLKMWERSIDLMFSKSLKKLQIP